MPPFWAWQPMTQINQKSMKIIRKWLLWLKFFSACGALKGASGGSAQNRPPWPSPSSPSAWQWESQPRGTPPSPATSRRWRALKRAPKFSLCFNRYGTWTNICVSSSPTIVPRRFPNDRAVEFWGIVQIILEVAALRAVHQYPRRNASRGPLWGGYALLETNNQRRVREKM